MDVVALGRQVFSLETQALSQIADRMDYTFRTAIELISSATGRVVVLGMGKSGIIGRKIVATLASTGTPSFFVHPGEAFHGDLGMIHKDDIALMISNSGETEELIRLIPFLQHQKNKIIGMTGKMRSTLAKNSSVVLDISVTREACNNNLAPTCSTTATLVMGDALAVVLSTVKGFQPEDFARFHPGGALGRRLLTRVSDVMHGVNLPLCTLDSSFRDVVHAISRGRLGLVLVVQGKTLQGIITDGDVRRAFERGDDPLTLVASEIMTPNPKLTRPDELFAVAEERMSEAKINSLVVVDQEHQLLGVLQIYDMQSARAQN